ncbi:uncharacterized protein LOC142361679 isoform X3 [Opisthocomus hoazin]|uniref:uncharacterized protein LOC142361679 isoform X3 n=1 Tax=Opisthocomus hoazin TaxID=30419 RepID=UPI003F52FBAE
MLGFGWGELDGGKVVGARERAAAAGGTRSDDGRSIQVWNEQMTMRNQHVAVVGSRGEDDDGPCSLWAPFVGWGSPGGTREDCSQPSPMDHTSNTWLRDLGASMGCVCELLCVWEASWKRSVEAPAACSWMGESRTAGTADEEGGRGRERSLGAVKVSCQCQELWY